MAAKVLFLRTDSDIVQSVRRGEKEALLDLFDRNRKPVVTLVTRNGGSTDDAEDVLHESVVIFWEKVRDGSFEQRAAVGTFIYGIAKRVWLQRLSRRRRESPDDGQSDEAVSDAPAPDETLLADEEKSRIHAAIKKLERTCRSLLILFYWENLAMEEIARLMGFANAQTAKAKKYQCKEKLRRLMQENDNV